jgi:hypothetical protein
MGMLGAGPLPVPRRRVVQHGEPGDRVERLAGRDVAAARPDHDAELALVVEGSGQGRLDQVRVRAEHRLVAPDERVRPGGHGPAALERVLAVVQAEAEDPLRRGHRRAEVLGPVLAAVPVLQAAGGVQRGRASRGERAERREVRVTGRLGDVDVAASGPDVQARAVRRGQGRESHEPGLLARVAWAGSP